MKCSECSYVVRPIVVVDIDGTLGEYHDHFGSFALMYHNRQQRLGHWDGSGEFEDYLGLTKEEYREAKLAYRQGGWKRMMPLYPDAIKFVTAAFMRSELWLATTRPWMRHDSTDPDTRHWLERHNIPYEHLLYDDHKYERLASTVDPDRVVMLLEDLPDQFELAEKYFPGKVVMIERSHNRTCRSAVTVASLRAAQGMALIRIEEWNNRYGE